MTETYNHPVFEIGEGAIDPDTRIQQGEITGEEVDKFVERLYGDEFYDEVDALNAKVGKLPSCCVDGRCGECALGFNAAGGTTSLVMAEALTEGDGITSYRKNGETAPEHSERMFTDLAAKGHRIGGHTGSNATAEKSDCGAQDRAAEIFGYLARRPEDVFSIITSLGVEIPEALHARIVANAQSRIDEGYFTNGVAIKNAYEKVGGKQCVPELQGVHKEVALTVNMKAGQTLNRKKLQQEFGDELQTFNLDVEGLKNGAMEISNSKDEAEAKFIAALYYNVATAAVLAGPSLRVVVRR